MSAAKHTPGPWFQHHSEHSIRVCNGKHESEEGCQAIAEAEIIGYQRSESEANARLIAAAPEMLHALELIRATLPADQKGHAEICDNAIRKARGEK